MLISVLASGASVSEEPVIVKLASFNVAAGKLAGPEKIAMVFEGFQPDILALSEVPGGDWVVRVGQSLDMPHSYIGQVSSANHKDKYKAILSRTPLAQTEEFVRAMGPSIRGRGDDAGERN